MASSKLSETLIGREVERAFANISGKPGDIRMNPIMGEQFIYGSHALERAKQAAYRRLLVREYFALSGPSDAPLVPIDEWDRDRAKHLSGLLGFITTQFMWSMERQDDLRVHRRSPTLLPACCGSTTTTSRVTLCLIFPLSKSPS
jgi:hypothetical protein